LFNVKDAIFMSCICQTSSIANFIALSWSVMIVLGCFKRPFEVSVVSSCRKAHPNREVCACPVIPTNDENGKLYLLVMYVVSKVTHCPYYA